jgi:eukaryotic-like serine/threonine-protein kinase
MTPRFLLIDADAQHRRRWREHISAAIRGAVVEDYDPVDEGPLPAEFTAAAYDAVLLGDVAGADEPPVLTNVADDLEAGLPPHDPEFSRTTTILGEEMWQLANALARSSAHGAWLDDLARRAEFAPVISLDEPDADGEFPGPGVVPHIPLARIQRSRPAASGFARALRHAVDLRADQRREARQRPGALDVYRFGNVVIRGERCLRPIAASPLSSVYLAESERVGRVVALKVLRQVPDVAEGAAFDRFLREYQIIASISHPNIVRIHDVGAADDHAFIAMEYFPRGDLRRRIKHGLSPEAALQILQQMASALAAVHDLGILHRDLKPGNVMLRADGTIALIDFGLAKEIAQEESITGRGEIFGTPFYMSPEQGHGRLVDVRSDLYSLGVIFYEMVTGKKPYQASTPMGVIYKHTHSPVPSLPMQFHGLQPLLDKLMAKQPEQRFQSATQLLAEVVRVAATWQPLPTLHDRRRDL